MVTDSPGEPRPARVCVECGHVNEAPTDYCLFCGAPLGSGGDDIAGAAGSREAWRVFGVPSGFVGREGELAAAMSAIQAAVAANAPALVVVTGPEGSGKTRFLDALNARLVSEHADALMPRAGCATGVDRPYAPFARLLRDRFYVPERAEADDYAARLNDGIRSLVGDERGAGVAARVGAMLGVTSESSAMTREEAERGWRRALVELFRADAERQQLVAAFDDIDRAGPETRALLGELLPELADVPVVFVVTVVDAEATADVTAQLDPDAVHTIGLESLTDDEIAAVTRSILARVEDLPQSVIERICDTAGGNPLVAEEAVRVLIREGAIDTRGNVWTADPARVDAIAMPRRVEEMVRARIELLDDDERRLLEDAAVIGDTFWLGALVVLERARTSAPDQAEELVASSATDTIRDRLDALCRRGILRANAGSMARGDTEYAFKHWVERRLHAERVDAAWRAQAHRLIAQWLQVRSAGDPESFLVAIAEHYASGAMSEAASDFFARAGRLCRDRYANARAVMYLRKAVDLRDPSDHLARADVLHDLGNLHALTGDHEAAADAFGEAARAAWSIGSDRRLAAALGGLGRAYRARADYDRAISLLGRALTRFEALGDNAGIAQTLDDVGRIHWIRGQYDQAEHEYERALQIRRGLGDKRALALSLSHIGTLQAYRGQFSGALERFREALEIRRREGDLQGIAESLNTIGYIFAERGDATAAVRVWAEAIDVAREAGDRTLEAALLNNLGESTLDTGDIAGAEKHLLAACDLAEQVGDRRIVFDAIRNLGVLHARKGDLRLALDHAEEALELAKALKSRAMEGVALRTAGELHAQAIAGRPDEGRAELAEAAFRSAVDIFRDLGNETELGRTYHSYGTFLVEQQLLVPGKKHLEMARDIFQRLEMRRILAQTEATIHDL